MNEYERVKYEELYRQAWEQQVKKDRKENPRLIVNNRYTNNTVNRENGAKGGRPKKEENKLKLTKEAEVLNRMLQRKMTLKDAAEIMGLSPKAASNMKRKYDLPR
tara:strand:+ start:145 stop:459 length:315 start_codon:yes stop_codon:yes gene_type:complete